MTAAEIKALRRAVGLSRRATAKQYAAAQPIGRLSQHTIRDWEDGRYEPRASGLALYVVFLQQLRLLRT